MPWADLLVAWRQVALYEHDYLYPICAEIAKRAGLYPLSRFFEKCALCADTQIDVIDYLLLHAFPRQDFLLKHDGRSPNGSSPNVRHPTGEALVGA
uniref:Uncharacterized protein n=1 Tax=Nephroselmis olivacea TaxID=31312 RepID=Q9TKZ0_NEPOL|nr:hypothetical protein NeolCp050 [Nephroselmis olivacea]AAD54826.1 unknown [Nephroselmis olivacea]